MVFHFRSAILYIFIIGYMAGFASHGMALVSWLCGKCLSVCVYVSSEAIAVKQRYPLVLDPNDVPNYTNLRLNAGHKGIHV